MNEKNITFAMDELDYLMAKVARVHGDAHPELIEIKGCYEEIKKAYQENNNEVVKDALAKAHSLSNGFVLPEGACQAYTRVYVAYKMLEEEYK